MTTMLDRVNKQRVDKLMSDPGWMATMADYTGKLRSGYFEHADVVFQKWERFSIDLYDVYPFIMVHCDLMLANIVCATIEIGEAPHADKHIAENNAILHKLWDPFCGEFWGGTQDEDGYIKVRRPIEFDMINRETNERFAEKFSGRFCLEVGYISAAKTLFYLMTQGRIARWPYGSKEIYLLQVLRGYSHED
jgi:hypothetical protein